jgi:hypothetical protein
MRVFRWQRISAVALIFFMTIHMRHRFSFLRPNSRPGRGLRGIDGRRTIQPR